MLVHVSHHNSFHHVPPTKKWNTATKMRHICYRVATLITLSRSAALLVYLPPLLTDKKTFVRSIFNRLQKNYNKFDSIFDTVEY